MLPLKAQMNIQASLALSPVDRYKSIGFCICLLVSVLTPPASNLKLIIAHQPFMQHTTTIHGKETTKVSYRGDLKN
jgi:hypothetical protein